jgi:hypothetical protein
MATRNRGRGLVSACVVAASVLSAPRETGTDGYNLVRQKCFWSRCLFPRQSGGFRLPPMTKGIADYFQLFFDWYKDGFALPARIGKPHLITGAWRGLRCGASPTFFGACSLLGRAFSGVGALTAGLHCQVRKKPQRGPKRQVPKVRRALLPCALGKRKKHPPPPIRFLLILNPPPSSSISSCPLILLVCERLPFPSS